MAINAKVVFIFGGDKWGWTETYYYSATSGDLDSVMLAAKNLAGKRSAVVGAGSTLEAIRVSDTATTGNSLLNTNNSWSGTGGIGPAMGSPWQAALINIQAKTSTGLYYGRKLMLRGIPNVWYNFQIANPTNPNLDPDFAKSLRAFIVALSTTSSGNPSSWSIRASNRDRTANPAYPLVTTVALSTVGSYFVVGIPTAPITWIPGTRIHIGGVKGPGTNGMNGDCYIIDVSGALYTISRRQTCPNTTIKITSKGVAYLRTGSYLYFNVTAANFERFVKRDTGRPFFGSVGHRSAAQC